MRITEHYAKLIDWEDPADPLRKIAVPFVEELDSHYGVIDPSSEKSYTVTRGLQHKYKDTVLLLLGPTCFSFCRFCFRKRLFLKEKDLKSKEILINLHEAIDYIKQDKCIKNVLLSGGDPLILPTKTLEKVLNELSKIPHVGSVRIGTKALAYYPQRVLEDDYLVEVINKYSVPRRRIYIVTNFNHPREITDESVAAVDRLMKAGAVLINQTPLLKGVNDNPDTLRGLFNVLVSVGISPYYVFY